MGMVPVLFQMGILGQLVDQGGEEILLLPNTFAYFALIFASTTQRLGELGHRDEGEP